MLLLVSWRIAAHPLPPGGMRGCEDRGSSAADGDPALPGAREDADRPNPSCRRRVLERPGGPGPGWGDAKCYSERSTVPFALFVIAYWSGFFLFQMHGTVSVLPSRPDGQRQPRTPAATLREEAFWRSYVHVRGDGLEELKDRFGEQQVQPDIHFWAFGLLSQTPAVRLAATQCTAHVKARRAVLEQWTAGRGGGAHGGAADGPASEGRPGCL